MWGNGYSHVRGANLVSAAVMAQMAPVLQLQETGVVGVGQLCGPDHSPTPHREQLGL